MPLSLLHFGVLAPFNHFAPGRISIVSFVLANLWMDGNSILYWAFNISAVSADGNEDAVLGAAAIAAILSVFGIKSSKWIYGAWLGAMSHVLLDMLVHPEKQPLAPIMGNPFYEGWMQPTSLVLLPLAIWFIAQCALRVFGWARKLQIVNKELL